MATAQNGWPVIPLARTATFLAPNGKIVYCANPDVATILGYVAWRWHLSIEPIAAATHLEGDPAVRTGLVAIHAWRPGTKILGTDVYSNHGAGMAMDINGHLHPYEMSAPKPYRDGFTAAQRAKLRALRPEVRALAGGADLLRIGLDFTPPRRDGMHVELWGTSAQMVRAAAAIRASGWIVPTKRGQIAAYQKVVGATADDHHGPATTKAVREYQKRMGVAQTGRWDRATSSPPLATIKRGSKGDLVRGLQREALRVFPAYSHGIRTTGGVDGVFGKGTEDFVREFQRRAGVKVDGIVGPDTWAALARHGVRLS